MTVRVLFIGSILLSHKADLAHAITLGNGLGQLQLTAKAFRDSPVTTHGVITQSADLLI